jgi:membrane-bound serine protease (ClpP class)
LDGREVILNDQAVVLHTQDAEVIEVGNTFVEELLLLLVNPNLVFLLLAVGIQGILIEIASPGGWAAGFIGVTCLLLASYGIGVLPVNWFGILFVLAAFVLFLLDIKAPTHGALTITGAVSFIMGALILFNSTPLPGFPTVSIPLVIGTGLIIGGIFFTIMTVALRAQRRPVQFGRETFPGKQGRVEVELNPRGMVRVNGELWSAELVGGTGSLPKGTLVEVISVNGLILQVKGTD